MPTFISREGKWVPAKERVVDPKAAEGHEVYEGPDRAAMWDLKSQGVEFLGNDFRLDPEVIVRARQMGFKDIKEYLTAYGYDEKKAAAEFERKAAIVNKHENPTPKVATRFVGGGFDATGNGRDAIGGFGEVPSVEDMVSKKK